MIAEAIRRMQESIQPSREKFGADPLGYSTSAWMKWGMGCCLNGFDIDISKPPTPADLKNPVLWMTHAHAMAESARIVFENKPNLDHLPEEVKGVCDAQYCAVGLMLVGYSLEICLKGMLIIRDGVENYSEKANKHHRLVDLADFIDDLSDKDKAILKALTYFTYWAGRYPDPGSKRIDEATDVFDISENYQITAKDLFSVAGRVMAHSQKIIG